MKDVRVENLNAGVEVDERFDIDATVNPIIVTQTGVINVQDMCKGINGLMLKVNNVKGYAGCTAKYDAEKKVVAFYIGFDINTCPFVHRTGGNNNNHGFAPLVSRYIGTANKGVDYAELFEKINGVFVGLGDIRNLQTIVDNNRLFVKINPKITLLSLMGIDTLEADMRIEKFDHKIVSKDPNTIQIIFSIISGEAIDQISARYARKKDKQKGSAFNPSMSY